MDDIDSMLAAGRLERIGMGSRRACYALPGGKFCVKCYRSDDEISEGRFPGVVPPVPLAPSVVREIGRSRFSQRRNTSLAEYRYWLRLRRRLPQELMDAFPGTVEAKLLPSRGWCIIEEMVVDDDGSSPKLFAEAWKTANESERDRLIAAFRSLAASLEKHAVRFFDPQNVLVQRTGGGGIRLRITDFEPVSRTAIPIDAISPSVVRRKVRRRFTRFLNLFIAADRRPVSMSFSITDSYAQHLAVVLASVLENNPSSRFVFHVLHSNVSAESQRMLRGMESSHPRCEVRFHQVDAAAFSEFPIPPELEHVTREMYYRYILPDVLGDESRTIYSDVDVIVAGDIRPLWEMDLKGNLVAAVSEGAAGEFKKRLQGLTDDPPYFYSGLLLMDLAALREGGYPRRLMENTVRYARRIAWPDQDIINITLRGRILQLGPEWDGISVRYSPLRKDIVIWHFPGFVLKPWCNIWKNTTWPVYLKYLLKTPYRRNAAKFVLGHVRGFFFFKYTKKRMTRWLVCGIRVWKRKMPK